MSFSSLFCLLLIDNYHQHYCRNHQNQLLSFNKQSIVKSGIANEDCKFHKTEIGKVKCMCLCCSE